MVTFFALMRIDRSHDELKKKKRRERTGTVDSAKRANALSNKMFEAPEDDFATNYDADLSSPHVDASKHSDISSAN